MNEQRERPLGMFWARPQISQEDLDRPGVRHHGGCIPRAPTRAGCRGGAKLTRSEVGRGHASGGAKAKYRGVFIENSDFDLRNHKSLATK